MSTGFDHFPARRLARGETVYSAWATLPEPLMAETAARAGFSTVTLDMQHGVISAHDIYRGVSAIHQGHSAAAVRLPIKAYDIASRVLDIGLSTIIMPMVNNAQEAQELVNATKYAPLGARSWGPSRAIDLLGISRDTYLQQANEATLVLAMIETPEAIDNLEDILKVPGMDGVFVGPYDLSITLSGGTFVNPNDSAVEDAIDYIVQEAEQKQKICGIYAKTSEQARNYKARGFRFLCVGSDQLALNDGYKRMAASLDEA